MHMHSLKLFETSKKFYWIKSQIALKTEYKEFTQKLTRFAKGNNSIFIHVFKQINLFPFSMWQ